MKLYHIAIAQIITEHKNVRIHLGSVVLEGLCQSYQDAAVGEVLGVISSYDTLEIAVNQGNAKKKLGLKTGDPIIVEFL